MTYRNAVVALMLLQIGAVEAVECPREHPIPIPGTPSSTAPTELSAERLEVEDLQRYRLEGNAQVRRGSQRIEAELLTYDRARGVLVSPTALRYFADGLELEGVGARVELDTRRGTMDAVRYRLTTRGAQGQARRVELVDRDRVKLLGVSYSTCPPGDMDWVLEAAQVELDRASGQGRAHDAVVRFKDLPILYAPYLRFPIDERRQSGLLAPRLGNSDISGVNFQLPYYWNIAPDRDATLILGFYSRRGLKFGGEYRYLSRTAQGETYAEALPDDQITHTARHFARWHENRSITTHLRSELLLQNVSDETYFQDLGEDLALASTAYLERRMDARYDRPDWSVLARIQDYQLLNAPDVYRRLPQIALNAAPSHRLLGIKPELAAEITHFARDVGVTGTRLDVTPGVSLPFGTSGYSVTPALRLQHTRYTLDDTPGKNDTPSRTTPISSIDATLHLERPLGSFTQTLEPRLYYLHVPFRAQDDIPLFDTAELDSHYSTLFYDNRFTGPDRIGDADQITTALTTRFIEDGSGQDRLSLALGAIHYFDTPRVEIGTETPYARSESDVFGEAATVFSQNWRARADLQWDTRRQATRKSVLRLHYAPDAEHAFTLGYRQRQGVLEQADVGLSWPLATRWQATARLQHSLPDARNLETVLGLQYRSCCYALHLVSRGHVNDPSGELNQAFYVQLELTGLGRLGADAAAITERAILDY